MSFNTGLPLVAIMWGLCSTSIGVAEGPAVAANSTRDLVQMPAELKQVQVKMSPAHGLKDQKWGRQDPSNILKIGDKYHVWYARYDFSTSWQKRWRRRNTAEIWMATSEDTHHWTEQGSVLPPSEPGAWHELGKHAPHVVPWNGRYYLFFTAHYGTHENEKHVGVAVADHPQGPYRHIGDGPVFSPSLDKGAFDSWLIDDPCIIRREGRFWMYYKGRSSSQSQCRLGVATASELTGPWERAQTKPVIDAKWHTGCVWPHRGGVAGIVDDRTNRIGWSSDGLHFVLGAKSSGMQDSGVFCADAFSNSENRKGIMWGLALGKKPEHIYRFHMDVRAPVAEPGKQDQPSNKPDAGDGL